MLIGHGGRTWDPDLDLAKELVGVVDRQMAVLEGEWRELIDADEFGVFDRMEHLAGLGFVACQTYMTSIYGSLSVAKGTALSQGPRHGGGSTIAEIVNHSANYWKHRDEWHLDRSAKGQERIRLAFEALGVGLGGDYPLAAVLTEITTPNEPHFEHVLAYLVEWRDHLKQGAG